MKSTGMVRKIDELGRIVIPSEIRQHMDIQIKDALEIFIEKDAIVLKKYLPGCSLCGEMGEVTPYMGKRLCRACIDRIKQL